MVLEVPALNGFTNTSLSKVQIVHFSISKYLFNEIVNTSCKIIRKCSSIIRAARGLELCY